jgi:hypothetical protein
VKDILQDDRRATSHSEDAQLSEKVPELKSLDLNDVSREII